jgi:uncharacterized BrkB/YihY/UPF0761 family membrane protein
MGVWDLARDTVRSFLRNGLPDLASAIAFQAVLAIVPFLLFLCALIGFLELEEIWREDVAPEIRDAVSTPVYRVINDTVEQSGARWAPAWWRRLRSSASARW